MRIAGVVVEYNPLHNGHLYHLQETKKKVKPDLLIAVMSGNFLQRGEPAILSKWCRAELALKAGIDLVVELPYTYATQNAPVFAWGAVSLLQDLGVTDLCYGSEDGRIEPFYNTLELLSLNQMEYQNALKLYLKQGNSYPKSQSLAFQSLSLPIDETIDLSKPNNILGFHYVEAIDKLGGEMTAHTIARTGAGYHDPSIEGDKIASATAIRKHLLETNGRWEELYRFVPPYTAEALRMAAEQEKLRSWEDYFHLLKYRLMTDSLEHLGTIYEAEEGLEYRLKKASRESYSFSDLMHQVKTKRYTWTRLQRLLTHVLTQSTKSDLTDAHSLKRPDYIRLLGMSEKGQAYLSQKKEGFRIPLISRLGKDRSDELERDVQAALVYDLLEPNKKSEFKHVPIRYITSK